MPVNVAVTLDQPFAPSSMLTATSLGASKVIFPEASTFIATSCPSSENFISLVSACPGLGIKLNVKSNVSFACPKSTVVVIEAFVLETLSVSNST